MRQRHAPPERRVLMGDCLLVRYCEADQEPGVVEQNRENERRRKKREEYAAAFKEKNPDKQVRLPKEQVAECKWSPEGLRLRLRIETDALSFKPERLNPFPKLLQLFSFKRMSVETIMSLLRVGLVGYVAYRALLIELPSLLVLARVGIEASGPRMVEATVRVMMNGLGVLAGVAAIDYAQSRYSIGKDMMMTRKEVMEESRSQDGDPKMKGRMRQRALAKKRSLQNVKTASVVVANPSHISVALRYSGSDPAPLVVAKGHDDVAMLIRAEARKYGIPILENRALARALDAEVPIGRAIPAAHFAAVARILAFVFRLKGRRVGTPRA